MLSRGKWRGLVLGPYVILDRIGAGGMAEHVWSFDELFDSVLGRCSMRFSIRDLLWATLVAGLALGWWTDHRKREAAEGWEYTATDLAKNLLS